MKDSQVYPLRLQQSLKEAVKRLSREDGLYVFVLSETGSQGETRPVKQHYESGV